MEHHLHRNQPEPSVASLVHLFTIPTLTFWHAQLTVEQQRLRIKPQSLTARQVLIMEVL